MPYHRAIDQARERLRGEGRIGTTGRGIGPTYEDKMARIGLRFAELVDERLFADALRATHRGEEHLPAHHPRRAGARLLQASSSSTPACANGWRRT